MADPRSGRSKDLGIPGIGPGQEIGQGGNAIVYRARQNALDRDVAVKILTSTDDATRRRFDRERRAMGRLSAHDGIVTVFDSGYNEREEPFLIMSLLDGSLDDELDANGAFEWRDAVATMIDVCDTVAFAHEQGVVHRDLKPGNIMRSAAGKSLVSDFGISRLSGATSSFQSTAITLTPAYSPPEALEATEAGQLGDIYSLGATLYALLAGTPPFMTVGDDTSLLVLMRRILHEPVTPLPVPPDLNDVLLTSMAKEPGDRYWSVAAMADALRAVAASDADVTIEARATNATVVSPSSTTAPASSDEDRHDATVVRERSGAAPQPSTEGPTESTGQKRRSLVWLGAAAALIAVLLVSFIASRSGTDDEDPGLAAAETTPVSTAEPEPAITTAPTTASEPEPATEPEPETETTIASAPTTIPLVVDRSTPRDGGETSLRSTGAEPGTVTVFDSVIPTSSGTIDTISWHGLYTFCEVVDVEAVPHVTAFDIEIYGDDGNASPNLTAPLYSTTIGVEETAQTKLNEQAQQPCNGFTNDSVWTFYSYAVDLDAGPAIEANTPIWFAIRAVAPGFDPFWGWRSSAVPTPPSLQLNSSGLEPVETGTRFLTVALESGEGVQYSIETEDLVVTSPMTIAADPDAAFGDFIQTTETESGVATAEVEVEEAGDYFIWARVRIPAGVAPTDANSFDIAVNDQEAEIWDLFEGEEAEMAGSWRWELVSARCGAGGSNVRHNCDPYIVQLDAGVNRIVIGGREPSTQLDSLIITNDATFEP